MERENSAGLEVKGNVTHLIAMLNIGWVIECFFEEWFFRG